MKKIWLPLLAVLLLCACGGENDRAEELQEQYQQVSSYETDVRVCVPREDETIAYCLHLSAQGDTVRAEVKEPQELGFYFLGRRKLSGKPLYLDFLGSRCRTGIRLWI